MPWNICIPPLQIKQRKRSKRAFTNSKNHCAKSYFSILLDLNEITRFAQCGDFSDYSICRSGAFLGFQEYEILGDGIDWVCGGIQNVVPQKQAKDVTHKK